MKLTEKQKLILARILEVGLFVFGISFGLMVLGMGFYMLYSVIKSLIA